MVHVLSLDLSSALPYFFLQPGTDWHRIEEQLEVQAAFRRQAELLQGIFERQQRLEIELRRR
jgi:hypothetical protein